MHPVYTFHPSVLREYDVRGIVGDTVKEADAYHLGLAYATLHRKRLNVQTPRIAVARDGRLSSPVLEAALCEGLRDGGMHVVTLGIGPTPMLYFAVFHQDLDGGIMITGSHNPPSHNGFKLMMGKKTLYGADIAELGNIAANAQWFATIEKGEQTGMNLLPDYIDTLLQAYDGERPLTAVWDAGNGAAGEVMAAVCAQLQGKHHLLNETIDGTFPAHHPDPSVPENLVQLIDKVHETKADVGLAFDGDGDRVGVVDGQGRILWGDQIMALLADDMLQKRPGALVIADVKASQMLFERIREKGGEPMMWKTGHSLVKAKMAETGAPLAGEMSGHIFFADRYYGFDDGLYAAIRVLGILARADYTLAEWLDTLPVWHNTPEIRFACDEARKFAIIEEVKTLLESQGADFIGVDGVRVNTADGWWLLRASNTQAVLGARAESKTPEGLQRLKQQLANALAASGVKLPEDA